MAAAQKTTTKDKLDAFAASVDVELVRRALKFAATQDVRYYLMGVCIQPSKSGGVLVMATDGHSALVLHDRSGKADKSYILPFAKGRNEKGLSERGASHVVVSPNGDIAVVDLFVKRFICPEPLIQGTFPDITAATGAPDDYEAGIKGGFNPAYMQRALDSAGKGRYSNDIRFFSKKVGGEDAVLLFTTQHGFGLVMPMREQAALEKKLTKDFGGII